MARPYLECPPNWTRATLEPNPNAGLITCVETGGTPSTTREDYWDGAIPWLTPKEITGLDGFYVSTTERTLTDEGLQNTSAKLVPAGAVLLTKRAPVGAIAINAVPMATNQGFLNFICGPQLRPLYFAYWLRANRPYLELVANGSTYPELYIGDLFEFELSVPSLDVQDQMIDILNSLYFVTMLGRPIEQSIANPEDMVEVQRQTRRLRKVVEDILPLLLSGKLPIEALGNHVNRSAHG